jgi:dihydrofolate reductase
MGRIALTQLTSLDGVMQSPGTTDVPFKYRGWIMDFDAGPEGDRFKLGEAQNAEALLLGRVAYEAMQAFWPTAEGEFADRLNELPKYVVSSTLRTRTGTRPCWAQEVVRLRKDRDVVEGDIEAACDKLTGAGRAQAIGLPRAIGKPPKPASKQQCLHKHHGLRDSTELPGIIENDLLRIRRIDISDDRAKAITTAGNYDGVQRLKRTDTG